jgi:hypothetical protein
MRDLGSDMSLVHARYAQEVRQGKAEVIFVVDARAEFDGFQFLNPGGSVRTLLDFGRLCLRDIRSKTEWHFTVRSNEFLFGRTSDA